MMKENNSSDNEHHFIHNIGTFDVKSLSIVEWQNVEEYLVKLMTKRPNICEALAMKCFAYRTNNRCTRRMECAGLEQLCYRHYYCYH